MWKKQQHRFIDVHCHILPQLDDGSSSMAQTIEMLRIAQSEGIEEIIVTPHYKSGHRNASPETINRAIDNVMEMAAKGGINIQLYPGNEIYYFSGVDEVLDKGEVNTLNNTDRVLIEFSPGEAYSYIKNAVDTLMGIELVPVIAHAERYECLVAKPVLVSELVNMGAEIQVNASSIAGDVGKIIRKFTHRLLDEELVCYVGTDAHSTGNRAPTVARALDIIYKKCSEEYAEAITYGNARELTHL